MFFITFGIKNWPENFINAQSCISYRLIMPFKIIKHVFPNNKKYNLRFLKRGVGMDVRM
jgi:hypothetical protein